MPVRKGNPPFQWLVSILQELYKGKGDKHNVNSFRDILLADTYGEL